MHTTVLTEILAFLFGRKYYANVVSVRGTDTQEICSYIFTSRQQALEHRRTLFTTASFDFVDTVSFRSRRIDLYSLTRNKLNK